MSIDIHCSCGRLIHADPAHAGKLIRCKCGRTMRVPPSRRSASAGISGVRALRSRIRTVAVAPMAIRIIAVLVWGYLAGVMVSALLLWGLGDRWWPATLLLFGPRWILLLPLAPLGVAALLLRRRWLLPLAGATLIVLGPVMGFRTGWRRLAAGDAQLRVVSFNVEGGDNPLIAEIPGTLAALGADIMLFQECPEEMVAAGRALGEPWIARRDRSLCLISRYPVDTTRSIGEIETRTAGSTGLVTLYQLRIPSGLVRVGNLHLETPRSGIEVWRGQGETRRLVRNTLLRRGGSARASGWLRDEQADLVGGDFNMPVESWIYRTDWSHCRNGFTQTGTGFGFTRILVRFSARIDHVLACSGWSPVRAFVGPDLGSDHRPMVVDLRRAGK